MSDALAGEAISRIRNPKQRMEVMQRTAEKMEAVKKMVSLHAAAPIPIAPRKPTERFDTARHEQEMMALETKREEAAETHAENLRVIEESLTLAVEEARAKSLDKLGPDDGKNASAKLAAREARRERKKSELAALSMLDGISPHAWGWSGTSRSRLPFNDPVAMHTARACTGGFLRRMGRARQTGARACRCWKKSAWQELRCHGSTMKTPGPLRTGSIEYAAMCCR